MTVDHQDPRESLAEQRLDDLRQDGEQRGLAQCRAAGVGGEARHAVGKHRHDRHSERLGRLDRRTLGEDVVRLEREVGVLLGRADGEDDPIVCRQVRL